MTSLVARLGDLRALRFVREPPAQIDAIVIVGSTCAGKTTLVGAVRGSALAGVCVPRRFVTRPPREGDVPDETGYVTSAELDAAIAAGTVGIHWARTLEPGRIEHYAFAPPAPGALAVYSANNAIYVEGNVRPADALARALLVGVFAPEAVREQRLRERSPALWRDYPAEARARLADSAGSMAPYVDAIIENHGALEAVARNDMLVLIRAAAQMRERS